MKRSLVVAAAFALEPLVGVLAWWLRELDLDLELELAPFDQLFQQLLDADSALRRADIGAVFVRRRDRCEELDAALAQVDGLLIIGDDGVAERYSVSAPLDPQTEALAAMPYSAAMYAALATELARAIHRETTAPLKVLVLDADNTLWEGVCAEDGAAAVRMNESLQRRALALQQSGVLLCIASKNDEADVRAVFLQRRADMLVHEEHITGWRVGWQPKSQSLIELATELDLGLDSFALIDDSPLEIAEVRSTCPDVIVAHPDDVPHVWPLDVRAATKEDRARTELYRRRAERSALRQRVPTLEEFVDRLELVVSFAPIDETTIARAAQLTLRTNQFNLSTIRRRQDELRKVDLDGFVVTVRDRFGDYGVVGLVLYRCDDGQVDVDTFLLSCRALGRGVEHRMLAQLAELDLPITLPFQATARNAPARAFVDAVGRKLTPAQARAATALKLAPPPRRAASKPSATRRYARVLRSAGEVMVAAGLTRAVQPATPGASAAPPESDREKELASLFVKLLAVEAVGIDDDFFALGGDSVAATRLAARAGLSLGDVFEMGTVRALARRSRDKRLPRTSSASATDRKLSPTQERLWFVEQMEPRLYNEALVIKISGAVDVARLKRCLEAIVARHDVLRMRFVVSERRPVAVVDDEVAFELGHGTLRDALEPAYDLSRAPLFRWHFRDGQLIFGYHHAIFDGWSVAILLDDLARLYAGAELEPIVSSYLDALPSEAPQQLVYWKKQLAGAVPLSLPSHTRRPGASAGRVDVALDGGLLERARAQARDHGVSLFNMVLSAFAAVLWQRTRTEDIVIATIAANRAHAENVMGPLLNVLPLRVSTSGDPTFVELVDRVRRVCVAALANQDAPYEQIVAAHRREPGHRQAGQRRLNDVLFALENVAQRPKAPEGLSWSVEVAQTDIARRDLSVQLFDDGSAVEGFASYRSARFDDHGTRRLWNDTAALLARALADPTRRLSTLCAGLDDTLASIFERAVDRHADRVALVAGSERLTYAELDAAADRVARRLCAAGIGREDVVAIDLERGADLVAATIGVAKSGAAWLSIDGALPQARVREMLDVSAARLTIDAAWMAAARDGPQGRVHNQAARDSLAYVVFTSGSTGRPKGVMVSQHAIVRELLSAQSVAALDESDVYLMLAPHSFDLSVEEIFWPLTSGGTLVLLEEGDQRRPDRIVAAIQRHGVTTLHPVPSLLRALLADEGFARCASLRRVIPGAEALPLHVVHAFFEAHPNVALFNSYGPTETTVSVSRWRCGARASAVAIGKGFIDSTLHVFDAQLRPVADGDTGELYIGGAQLARGYLADPAQTAACFVPAPGGGRLYRSGDLVRRWADGNIEFVGRRDRQIKLRGFRVELSEIEDALDKHAAVDAGAVVAQQAASGTLLAAHVVTSLSEQEVRAHLAAVLPAYMVPARIDIVDALPRTASGKIDRKSLAAPATRDSVVAPSGICGQIAAIFASALSLPAVGADEDFFALGGHSLLVTEVIHRIDEELGVMLPFRALFEASTPALLAARVESKRQPVVTLEPATVGGFAGLTASAMTALMNEPITSTPPVVEKKPATKDVLSFAQERMWVLHQVAGDRPVYTIPFAQRLRGPIDAVALGRAISDVVARHDALHTVFTREPRPRVIDAPPIELSAERVSRDELAAHYVGAWLEPFDLENGPLLRARLWQLSPDEHVLLICVHHIAADGHSMRILWREVMARYRGEELPPVSGSYAAFAAAERRRVKQGALDASRAYWQRKLEGARADVALPAIPRQAEPAYRGARHSVTLGRPLTAELLSFCQSRRATLYMGVLAAFRAVLSLVTEQRDLCIGTAMSVRSDPKMVGMLANTVVLRDQVDWGASFEERLARERITVLEAIEHKELPFNEIALPLRVMFAWQEPEPGEPYRQRLAVSKFDLEIEPLHAGDRLEIGFLYDADIFERWVIESMADQLSCFVHAALATPHAPMSTLRRTSLALRETTITAWNATARDHDPRPVHQLIAERAAKAPDSVALVFRDERISYGSLLSRARALAALLQEQGVGPEGLVALSMDRSADMVIAILGVWLAGGAYLPMDPSYPKARLEHMRGDAMPTVELTALPPLHDGDQGQPTASSSDPRRLAYMIYTSGSTGGPKGALLTHRGLSNLAATEIRLLDIKPSSRVLAFASLSFDASVWEIFATLVAGATSVIAPPEALIPGVELRELLQREKVTHATLPPTVLSLLRAENLPALECVVSAGEACTPAIRRALGCERQVGAPPLHQCLWSNGGDGLRHPR